MNRRQFFLLTATLPFVGIVKVKKRVFDIPAAINWQISHITDARWDIVARAMRVMETGFKKKKMEAKRMVSGQPGKLMP